MIAPLPSEPPAPYLSTSLEADWACAWLSLAGELVETTISDFEEALAAAVGLGCRKIVVLTVGVSNMDAAGLAAIGRARDSARAKGIKLAVRSARRPRSRRGELGLGSRRGQTPAQWWPTLSGAVRRAGQVGALQLHSSD